MMDFKLRLFICLVTLSLAKCNQFYFPDNMPKAPLLNSSQPIVPDLTAIKGSPEYETVIDRIISEGIAKTTLAINRVILETSRSNYDNIVFAPVSISAALALVLLGSNGKTYDEIISLMGLATGMEDLKSKSLVVHTQFGRMIRKVERTSGFDMGSEVLFASSIFVQDNFPIRSLYKQTAEDLYECEVLNVDFERNIGIAEKQINAWVSDRTHGKITDIVQNTLSSSTKVVIVSAMYFKAAWERPFFPGTTHKHPFYTNGQNSKATIDVELMANGGFFPYFNDEILNCEVMGLPYKGNKTVMYVVKPVDSNMQILRELELKMTAADLNRLADSTELRDMVTLFPKMKIESTLDLTKPLYALGVKSLFNASESNLALLSPGTSEDVLPALANQKLNVPIENVKNPLAVDQRYSGDNDVLIFSRIGQPKNCTQAIDPNSPVNVCQDKTDITEPLNRPWKKINRRIQQKVETLDSLRELINTESTDNRYKNPGLYADKVIHKVYMDITETGTEAAAATGISLTRSGNRVAFRVDVPFFFFIRHEETKQLLFWGSVNAPVPNFKRQD